MTILSNSKKQTLQQQQPGGQANDAQQVVVAGNDSLGDTMDVGGASTSTSVPVTVNVGAVGGSPAVNAGLSPKSHLSPANLSLNSSVSSNVSSTGNNTSPGSSPNGACITPVTLNSASSAGSLSSSGEVATSKSNKNATNVGKRVLVLVNPSSDNSTSASSNRISTNDHHQADHDKTTQKKVTVKCVPKSTTNKRKIKTKNHNQPTPLPAPYQRISNYQSMASLSTSNNLINNNINNENVVDNRVDSDLNGADDDPSDESDSEAELAKSSQLVNDNFFMQSQPTQINYSSGSSTTVNYVNYNNSLAETQQFASNVSPNANTSNTNNKLGKKLSKTKSNRHVKASGSSNASAKPNANTNVANNNPTANNGSNLNNNSQNNGKNLFDYKENYYYNNNSEDEYESTPSKYNNDAQNNNFINLEEIEENFCRALKEKKGFIIKPMKEDGACLFRAVADQIYGDEEMHSTVRCHCMDYIAKNADYFKQYLTEDVERYINRKRQDSCYGNHIEIIAIAEIFNRPIEVYEYGTEPKNTFQSVFQTDNEPIRLSYHGRNHYNSVVDPYKATIGVGLGLPQLIPGLAEKNLMSEAMKKSEEFHIEQAMLDDKLKATDWEATNEELMELVAQESYLQWLKDNEKRIEANTAASCSSWDTSAHHYAPAGALKQTSSPDRLSRANSKLTHNNHHHNKQQQQQQQQASPKQHVMKKSSSSCSDHQDKSSKIGCSSSCSAASSSSIPLDYYETKSIMNQLPPDLFGLAPSDEWASLDNHQLTSDNDILAQVLAASQQEYLDSLKAKRHQQH